MSCACCNSRMISESCFSASWPRVWAKVVQIKLPWKVAVTASVDGGTLCILKCECKINKPITADQSLPAQSCLQSRVASCCIRWLCFSYHRVDSWGKSALEVSFLSWGALPPSSGCHNRKAAANLFCIRCWRWGWWVRTGLSTWGGLLYYHYILATL